MKKIYTTSSYIDGDHVTIVENVAGQSFKDKDVSASFMITLYKNKVVFAHNRHRGLEIAGGHVEKGECSIDAALRENREETGTYIEEFCLIARITHECYFEKPKDYKYPYPTSYMEFFLGHATKIDEYIENDECKAPILIEFVNRGGEFVPILTDEQIPLWNTFCEKNTYLLWILQQALKYNEEIKMC